MSPNRLDADLLRVKRVRVTLRVEAASDEMRAGGLRFALPGLSLGGTKQVPDLTFTFDVAPRNMNLSR